MTEGKSLTKFVRPLSKGQITLPIEFRRRLKIGADTMLKLTLKDDRIEIIPLRHVPEQETLRDYALDEIERFLEEDRIDRNTAAKVRRLLDRKSPA